MIPLLNHSSSLSVSLYNLVMIVAVMVQSTGKILEWPSLELRGLLIILMQSRKINYLSKNPLDFQQKIHLPYAKKGTLSTASLLMKEVYSVSITALLLRLPVIQSTSANLRKKLPLTVALQVLVFTIAVQMKVHTLQV